MVLYNFLLVDLRDLGFFADDSVLLHAYNTGKSLKAILATPQYITPTQCYIVKCISACTLNWNSIFINIYTI